MAITQCIDSKTKPRSQNQDRDWFICSLELDFIAQVRNILPPFRPDCKRSFVNTVRLSETFDIKLFSARLSGRAAERGLAAKKRESIMQFAIINSMDIFLI